MLTCCLYFDEQLAGASPELVNKLIPDHVKRQIGLSFFHPAGTWTYLWYVELISANLWMSHQGMPSVFWIHHAVRPDQQSISCPTWIRKWLRWVAGCNLLTWMLLFYQCLSPPIPPNAFSYLYMFDSIYSLSLNWSKAVSRELKDEVNCIMPKRWGLWKENGHLQMGSEFLVGIVYLFLLDLMVVFGTNQKLY